jgi:hypothetical protein
MIIFRSWRIGSPSCRQTDKLHQFKESYTAYILHDSRPAISHGTGGEGVPVTSDVGCRWRGVGFV